MDHLLEVIYNSFYNYPHYHSAIKLKAPLIKN